MFGDNFGGGGFSGGGYVGGDYTHSYSSFDSFNSFDNYSSSANYDARADVYSSDGIAFDVAADNAATGIALYASAQAERELDEAIERGERIKAETALDLAAEDAALAAASAAALADASKPGLFARIRGVFGLC